VNRPKGTPLPFFFFSPSLKGAFCGPVSGLDFFFPAPSYRPQYPLAPSFSPFFFLDMAEAGFPSPPGGLEDMATAPSFLFFLPPPNMVHKLFDPFSPPPSFRRERRYKMRIHPSDATPLFPPFFPFSLSLAAPRRWIEDEIGLPPPHHL